ncbi:MAG: ribbon-helix-helix domain-containing protein [Alphaproteobacteria bacterium]|nr:ribbon-helix-helix domain-containing protein [Alphaproteobacteria bacterium]
MFAVRLPKEMEHRLNVLSERTHRPKSYYVKKALAEYLENQADIELAAEAYKDTLGKKNHSFDGAMNDNGLDPIQTQHYVQTES